MNLRGVAAAALLVAGCGSDHEPSASSVETANGSGVLAVGFVLDNSTDYADYSDGYELFVDLAGPVDDRVVGDPTGERTVLIERAVPAGAYRVGAGLLPCETDEDRGGPERDSCESEVDITDERVVLTVDFQPGRPCSFESD